MQKEPVIIDAKGRSLGRVASEAALFLRGKTSPSFERHITPSQRLVIKNAAQIRVTGKKMLQESRERYSGYPGGLKHVMYQTIFKKDPRELVRKAITGMIPRNRLRKDILKHLTIYAADKN